MFNLTLTATQHKFSVSLLRSSTTQRRRRLLTGDYLSKHSACSLAGCLAVYTSYGDAEVDWQKAKRVPLVGHEWGRDSHCAALADQVHGQNVLWTCNGGA